MKNEGKTVLRDKQKKTTSKYTLYIYLFKYKAFSSTGHFISLTLNFTFNIMKQLIHCIFIFILACVCIQTFILGVLSQLYIRKQFKHLTGY